MPERRSPSDFARRVGNVGKHLFSDRAMETGDTTRLASWTNSAGLGLQPHDQAGQQGRQVLLAVPVVVLEVVALGLQGVVVLVLDLPAAAPGLDDLRHVAVAQRQVGRKGVAVQHLALRRGGGEFAPVDFHRVVRVAQRDRRGIAVGVGLVALAGPAGAHHGVDGADALQVLQPLVGGGVGVGLADQDEVQPVRPQYEAVRLMAVQIIAQDDRLQLAEFLAVLRHPALGGVDLAILLLRAVLRRDELRGQRDHLVATRLDQHRGHDGVEIRHRAVGVLPRRTLVAMDGLRREVLRPVEGEQQAAVQRTVRIHHPGLPQGVEQAGINRLQHARRGGVEQGAYLVVRRDFMDTKQRPGIVFPVRLLQGALVFQKRGTLHEEHRKGAQPRVDQSVAFVLALPGIDKRLESATYQSCNIAHGQGKAAKGCAHCVYSSRVNSATLPDNRQNENCWFSSLATLANSTMEQSHLDFYALH